MTQDELKQAVAEAALAYVAYAEGLMAMGFHEEALSMVVDKALEVHTGSVEAMVVVPDQSLDVVPGVPTVAG